MSGSKIFRVVLLLRFLSLTQRTCGQGAFGNLFHRESPTHVRHCRAPLLLRAGRVWEGGGAKAGHMCKNSWQHKEKLPWNLQTEKKGICRGHSLFSPEAVIYLGQNPTLNHCVCFYGLSGFVCAPQPLKAVWGAADFSPNLGIVKPHRFLALEECLASRFLVAAEDQSTLAHRKHADELRMCVCFRFTVVSWRRERRVQP